ncbi:hypothetical protein SAMN05421821_11967 [Mucilaginibacter lappiensis]|nr:hypothetical protein SAMN05421821_11967 [Mucilaginibacter lappiensis]
MLHEGSEGSGRDNQQGTVSAKQYLGLETGKSYSTPKVFLAYCLSLREIELKDLEVIIRCMNERLRINRFTPERPDKIGKLYSYLNFTRAYANETGKLILEAGMKELLDDYINGKAIVTFTLTELIDESKKH